MKYIVGTKVGMVRLFETNGRAIAATIVHCEPNVVLEVKTPEKHGHSAVKIGYNEIKENKKNKPHNGIFKKVGVTTKQFIKTFTNTTNQYNVGDFIKVDTFESGEYVDVQGKTRGRGFTGAIERWNFKIGPLSHGAGYPHRYQGSIALGRGGSQAQRVAKGKKMHGHYGHETVTSQNLNVLLVNARDNLIIVSGAIPGPDGSVVTIKSSNKKVGQKVKFDLISQKNQDAILAANEKLQDKDLLHETNEKIEELEKNADTGSSQGGDKK